MARQRFVAPARGEVPAGRFEAPIFAEFARHAAWIGGSRWPDIGTLNRALGESRHPHTGVPLRFVEQTPVLLGDGLHYETRIHERGEIATRAANWHDLFNALMWIDRLPLKAALNVRQAADVSRAGRDRTRAQCAQTHFDEAGAIVVLRDAAMLQAWDAHDWRALFHDHAPAWRSGAARVIVFGHALLEHALQAEPVHTAKCLAVLQPSPSRRGLGEDGVRTGERLPVGGQASPPAFHTDEHDVRAGEGIWHGEHHPHPGPLLEGEGEVVGIVAAGIHAGALLADPQELRPLPLSGIPGWHPQAGDVEFYTTAPCFRPLRPGRVYPAPLALP